MKVLKWMIAGGIGAVCVFAESFREQLNFKVTRYSIHVPKMDQNADAKKIVFLSDLHNHEYGKRNNRLMQAIIREKPDLIFIGGDMLIGKEGVSAEVAWKLIRQLPRIAPVYYANGNHEQRMKEDTVQYGNVYPTYKKELEEAGVHFLENGSAMEELNGCPIRITGLELPSYTYTKLKRMKVEKENIEDLIGEKDENAYQILLAHNPTYYKAYKEWGADLVLSGHLHGGMARIPGWRGVITPQAFLFPKYSGEMTQEDGKTIVVSRGLGSHTIPIRLFNKPELVVMELSGKEK